MFSNHGPPKRSRASGPSAPPRQLCPQCQQSFTVRSLHEHLETSHLGVKCHFPGSTLHLIVEDDFMMIQGLLSSNFDNGGGYRNGEYWCHWPDCNEYNLPHAYKYVTNMTRHLRMKQKRAYMESLNISHPISLLTAPVPVPAATQLSAPGPTSVIFPASAQVPVPIAMPPPPQVPVTVPTPVVAPTPFPMPSPVPVPQVYGLLDQAKIDEAILQVRLAMARRETKFESFKAMVMPQDPNERMSSSQCTKFRIEIKEVNTAVDEAIDRILALVGQGPKGNFKQLCWDEYSNTFYTMRTAIRFWLNHYTMVEDQVQEWNTYLRYHTAFRSAVDKVIDEVKKIPCGPANQPVTFGASAVEFEWPCIQ